MDMQSKSLANALALSAIGLLAAALLLSATPASAARVGYYDLAAGQGVAYQEAPIKAAGHTPVQLFTLSPAELAGVDVLFALNPSNAGYGAEYVAAHEAITTAVNNGLVLCFADRRVTEAATRIPGGSGISFTRNVGQGNAADTNIDIFDNTTLVTNGPGGMVTNTNLDGGNFSNHGFATPATLPAGNRVILVRAPNEAVTFSYPQGNGAVVYSTVPLDFYLQGAGNNPPADNFRNIYAPNLVDYCAALAERSSLGPISLRYCHSAGHSGDPACVKNGLSTTGKVASQSLPDSGCAAGQPKTGKASVRVIAGGRVAFAWDDINCGTIADSLPDNPESFAVNSIRTPELLGTVLELKAEHAMNTLVGLRVMPTLVGFRVVPPETENDRINSLIEPLKSIVVESVNETLLRKFVINGDERLVIQFRNTVPDVIMSAAVKYLVGSKKFFPPQTIIVKAFLNSTLVGQDTRVLSGDEKTGLSELQVYTSGNFGNKPFDKLEFSAASGSFFALGPVFLNTTRPVSP